MKRLICLLIAVLLVFSFCLPSFADDMLFCRMCGRRIPTDSRVCPYCGVSVVAVYAADQNGEADASPAPAAQPVGASTPATDSASGAPTPATDSAPGAPTPATDSAPGAQAAVPGPFGSTRSPGGQIAGNVYVTKSPTSESVPYGGSCLFIAHAANATSITWYFCNPESGAIAEASEAADYISGFSVSGAKSDTLALYGIPSWMNGFMVQACFEGNGGPVYTDIARIWTYEEPQPQPCWRSAWEYWYWYPYWYYDEFDLPEPPSHDPPEDVVFPESEGGSTHGDVDVTPVG